MKEPVVNTWDQVGHGGVFIAYFAPQPRSVIGSRAQVIRPGFKTDPKAAWYDNDCKTFSGKKVESVAAAKEWASKRYGIKNWRMNSMGDYVDADADLPPLRRDVDRKKASA